MKIAVNGGNLSTASTMTTTSGRNSTSDGWKNVWIAWAFSTASKSPGRPRSQKTTSESARATLEVSAVSRTCWYRSTPAAAAARLLESESGEVVSPK